MSHDPQNVTMGQIAISRQWLTREQCQLLLAEATQRGCSLADLAQSRQWLNHQQYQFLQQQPQWGQTVSDSSAVIGSLGHNQTPASSQKQSPLTKSQSSRSQLPEVGETVNGYEIVSLLGRGGMGAVYKARSNSGKELALKFILGESKTAMARFEREAQAVAAVDRHPNIVSIYKFSRHRDYCYLVLDYIDGNSLDGLLTSGQSHNIDESVEWTMSIAQALYHVHERGITHRDLKPANILIGSSNNKAYLTDFGLAKVEDGGQLTKSTEVLGTPHYMAPEQAGSENEKVGPASDIWALGVILYKLLTGHVPFQGNTVIELATAIMFSEPEWPRTHNNEIPKDLETIVLKCLEKESELRYESAAALYNDCQCFLAGDDISASRSAVSGVAIKRWARRHPWSVSLSIMISTLTLFTALIVSGVLTRIDPALVAWRQETKILVGSLKKDIQGLKASRTRHIVQHLHILFKVETSGDTGECQRVTRCSLLIGKLDKQLKRAQLFASGAKESGAFMSPRSLRQLQKRIAFFRMIEGLTVSAEDSLGSSRFARAFGHLRKQKLAAASVEFEESLTEDSNLAPLANLALSFIAYKEARWKDLLDLLALIPKDDFSDTIKELESKGRAEMVISALLARRLSRKMGLIVNLRTYYKKAYQNSESGWQTWNDLLSKRFAELSKNPAQRVRLAQGYESMDALKKQFPELIKPPVSKDLRLELAVRAKRSGRTVEALDHYLELKKLSSTFQAPEGFRPGELDTAVLNAMVGGGIAGMKKGFLLVLAASRAGWFLESMPEDFLLALEKVHFFDQQVKKAPLDPCPRFWRGYLRLPFELRKKKYKDYMLHVRQRMDDLNFALAHEDFKGSLRAAAYYKLAECHRESKETDKEEPELLKRAVSILKKALPCYPAKPEEVWLRLGNYTDAANTEVRLRYLENALKSLNDRIKRTQEGRLHVGRPEAWSLQPIFWELSVIRRLQIFNKISQTYRVAGRLDEAMVAARRSLKIKENGEGYDELGQNWLARGQLQKAQEVYNKTKTLFPGSSWRLKDAIGNYKRKQKRGR
jgi:serine/threonine protein kinase/tetratricopeptide (TPR) repeat protein